MDLRGRQTNLTRNPGLDTSPAVSRSGQIAFVSARDGQPEVYLMNPEGSNVRRLTTSPFASSTVAWDEALDLTQISWSPDGKRLAFDTKGGTIDPSCYHNCVTWQVWTIGAGGANLRRVTQNGRSPAWSPAGGRLAFASGLQPYGEAESVTVSRLDGSRAVEISAFNNEPSIGPTWSPDGSRLAFNAWTTSAGGPFHVEVVRNDGSGRRRIATGRQPVWSPDGRELAYISNGRPYTIDPLGRNTRRLTGKSEQVFAAAWSPGGGSLAFVAGTPSPTFAQKNLRVQTVTADGKTKRLLRREPAGTTLWSGPIWSPAGRILLSLELPPA